MFTTFIDSYSDHYSPHSCNCFWGFPHGYLKHYSKETKKNWCCVYACPPASVALLLQRCGQKLRKANPSIMVVRYWDCSAEFCMGQSMLLTVLSAHRVQYSAKFSQSKICKQIVLFENLVLFCPFCTNFLGEKPCRCIGHLGNTKFQPKNCKCCPICKNFAPQKFAPYSMCSVQL